MTGLAELAAFVAAAATEPLWWAAGVIVTAVLAVVAAAEKRDDTLDDNDILVAEARVRATQWRLHEVMPEFFDAPRGS